jgi:hypothetical protein
MALKIHIQTQEDFTGEFPAALAKSGLWRFNEDSFDDQGFLMDSSGNNRKMEVINRSGTTAGIRSGVIGNYVQLNLHDPGTEQSYLKLTNDGSIFQNISDTILVGGWIKPTIYSIGNTYCPLFNTRSGPGQPIFYLSFFQGRPRIMLYNEAGSLILDRTTSPSFTLKNGGIYFIACIIRPNAKTAQYVIGDRSDGKCWVSEVYSFTGELNRLCTADIIMGMHAGSYWYAGGFDDWFLDTDSELTMQDLEAYFRSSYFASGGDSASSVDALTEPGKVLLKKTDGVYPLTGELLTTAKPLSLSGTGRIAITKEYEAGVTDISAVEYGLSSDLSTWGEWTALPEDGKIEQETGISLASISAPKSATPYFPGIAAE